VNLTYTWAKRRRLSRLMDESGRFFILALDHGLSVGPMSGLEDISRVVRSAAAQGITGAVLNRGFVPTVDPTLPVGIVLQEMGMPTFFSTSFSKVPTATVEDALRMGVDAISVQIDFASPDFDWRFEQVCSFISRAAVFELPVLAMVNAHADLNPLYLAQVIRGCTEVGVDIIKVGLPSKLDSALINELRRVVDQSPPVLLAGGPASANDFEETIALAASLRFSGVCVGRNVFQSADLAETIATIKRAFAP